MATVVTVLFLLAGCSGGLQGSSGLGEQPTGPTVTSEQSTKEATSREPDAEGSLAGLEPCDLLNDQELASLGLTGGEEKDFGGARVCRWRHEGSNLDETFTVSVELFDLGLADLNVPHERVPNIGTHEAASFRDPTEGCGVSIGVSDTSRVDNTAIGGDPEQACEVAAELAEVVEPKLPGQQ